MKMRWSLDTYRTHSYGFRVTKLIKRKMKFEPIISTIKSEDITSGFQRIELKGHTRTITCCKFVPLKRVLVSASKDSSIILCKFALTKGTIQNLDQ